MSQTASERLVRTFSGTDWRCKCKRTSANSLGLKLEQAESAARISKAEKSGPASPRMVLNATRKSRAVAGVSLPNLSSTRAAILARSEDVQPHWDTDANTLKAGHFSNGQMAWTARCRAATPITDKWRRRALNKISCLVTFTYEKIKVHYLHFSKESIHT